MHDSRSQGLGSSSGRIIMLCSSVRHSASTQEYKWLPAKYHLKKCRLVKNGGGGGGGLTLRGPAFPSGVVALLAFGSVDHLATALSLPSKSMFRWLGFPCSCCTVNCAILG